ncbi:hypothetical protein ACMZ8J_01285 [Gardnerella vaginalis]
MQNLIWTNYLKKQLIVLLEQANHRSQLIILVEAWMYKSAPKELLIEAYNLLDPYECGDDYDDIADDLGVPRKVHSPDE